MDFIIRDAVARDMAEVQELIQKLEEFEKEPEAVIITAEDLKRDGFGEQLTFSCIVPKVEEKIHGIPLCYFRYSTWKGKMVHLEDLVIGKIPPARFGESSLYQSDSLCPGTGCKKNRMGGFGLELPCPVFLQPQRNQGFR